MCAFGLQSPNHDDDGEGAGYWFDSTKEADVQLASFCVFRFPPFRRLTKLNIIFQKPWKSFENF